VLSSVDQSAATSAMAELLSSFIVFSERTAARIISDLSLPPEKRAILALPEQKGIAGGLKYMVGGVFFKWARDHSGLYGCDEFAQKAASNEIRAQNAVIDSDVGRHLRPTLSCLVNVGGHNLICTAVAPITSQTLVYGSDSGGLSSEFYLCLSSINNSLHVWVALMACLVLGDAVVGEPKSAPRSGDGESPSESMRALVGRLAAHYRLKPHVIESFHGTRVRLSLAGDVEGHRSQADGRLYVVDLARLFPPTPAGLISADGRSISPSAKHANGHLWLQFRPVHFLLHCFTTSDRALISVWHANRSSCDCTLRCH
jgi:hypothetical protein